MKNKSILTLVITLSVILQLIYLNAPINRGTGYYLYAGHLILSGKIPFKDYFDHKPPGMHYLMAAVFALFGESLYAVRYVTILINIVSAMLLYVIGQRVWGQNSGMIAIVLFLFNLPLYEGYATMSEELILFFGLLGVLSYLLFLDNNHKTYLFCAGLSFGISVLFKQTGVLSFLVVILFHVLQRLHVKVDSKDILEFCSLIIGFLLPVVILLVYLNSQNALSSFIKSIIDKNLTSYPPQGIGALIEYSFKAVMTSPLLWMLSLYALFPPNKITTNGRIIALLFIASLIPTLVRQYSHYYIPGIAYASLLSSAALIDLWKMLPELKKKLYPAWVFCCISLIFLLAPLLFNLVVEYNILQKEHLLKDYFEVGGYINVNTKPTDKILVIAAEPQFYFLSQRDAVNEYTFIGDVDYYDGLEEKMIQDALNQNVRYFVVVENPYLYQYTGKVHDFIAKNSVLERTWPGKYPIKVYRKVK